MEQQEDLLQEIEQEAYLERVSPGMRFANYIIDLIVFYVLYFITFIAIGAIYATSTAAADERISLDRDSFILSMGFVYLVVFGVFLIYYTVMEGATKGRTIGKLVTGSRVVMNDGTPFTWKAAFLRSLCRLIPFEAFSAFGGNPWHDSITNTAVVKMRR